MASANLVLTAEQRRKLIQCYLFLVALNKRRKKKTNDNDPGKNILAAEADDDHINGP